ncbi:hypothetical protein [Flavobacterium sp. FlaQc-30]|uniref:hypothetical protein n=1 Tax=Flavobacterium sp. FlaQc-30 TaxID=3374179 RepID=UPI003758217A
MEPGYEDFALTIKAEELEVPCNLTDEILFLAVRWDLLELLANPKTEIVSFGAAPDNTADGQDELLENGFFYRIIAYEKNLGIGLESPSEEILNAFHQLVSSFQPRWATVFTEEGSSKREVTIELMYQEVF